MARRYDPERRDRIVDAAIKVAAERGIAALSHRAVAAEADVPLGSTTYHFKTLDDLLVAALRRTARAWLDGMAEWERGLAADASLAELLTGQIVAWLAEDRARLELEYELYLAALRRPAVRPIATECVAEMVALFRRRTADEATARALVAFLDGLVIQLLITGRPFDRAETLAVLRAMTG